ncbi:MAG: hypothetical protein MHM6MM_003689 [Cercozoa sp. M6MM]
MSNFGFVLAKRPAGHIDDETFTWKNVPLPDRTLRDGEVLATTLMLSIDPAMRGWMRPYKSYVPPVPLGSVMRANTVAQVVASKGSKLKPGDIVLTFPAGGWQQHFVVKERECRKLPLPANASKEQVAPFLGAFGLTGATAFFGLVEVAQVKEGDTVLVNAAAGAVGSVVIQLAKQRGAKVVAVAGGSKTEFCRQVGADACVDYKSVLSDLPRGCADGDAGDENYDAAVRQLTSALRSALKSISSKGFTVVFDNVGGAQLEAALNTITRGARIAVCGAISQYNRDPEKQPVRGPRNYLSLLVHGARMQGFAAPQFSGQSWAKAFVALQSLASEGKLKWKTHFFPGGLQAAPDALRALFAGKNKGKLVLEVSEAVAQPGQDTGKNISEIVATLEQTRQAAL